MLTFGFDFVFSHIDVAQTLFVAIRNRIRKNLFVVPADSAGLSNSAQLKFELEPNLDQCQYELTGSVIMVVCHRRNGFHYKKLLIFVWIAGTCYRVCRKTSIPGDKY